ncbi:DNA primase [Lactobacillus sp. PV034]|uniref:DNA primase n=1 Tax=Lactobacillus sp. PV034 TaxID=2594495 RepID=UPI00223FA2F9|nr:DNA primase [Lactobacillus sp. PV034]QNQ80387.1 DNA primase [Lactobacillus sp. PV034]
MAGRIPESFINEVSNAVNIVDVIGQYVSLEKRGKDYIGLCPFHQEKTPSFTVNESKQFFKCFGCGKGGNVFKFLMYQENLSFPESVRRVAEFANISMPNGVGAQSTPLSPLLKMYEEATEFYHHILLTTKAGEVGLTYAKNRDLNEELLKHFKIGYAPDNDTILLTFLKQKGYEEELLRRSGLFVETKDGRLFDRFRNRLMFPLSNENGRTIAFSGRRISDNPEIAKYVNSPETEIFTKSKLLYHLSEAKKAVRDEGHLVLYEGYMDVIAAYKAGVKSGVASMGTSLTDEQVYLLRRIRPNVIINYDGDKAGVHAAERAITLFNKVSGFNIGIVVLPDNLDPDEYVKKYSAEKYRHEINGAISPTKFLLKRSAAKYNLHNEREKLAYINDGIAIIAQLNNPVESDIYLSDFAKEVDVSIESLKVSLLREQRKLRKSRQHQQPSLPASQINEVADNVAREPKLSPQYSSKFLSLQRLLYLFIHSEEARNYLLNLNFLFPDKSYALIAEKWLEYLGKDSEHSIKDFTNFIPEDLGSIIVDMELADMPADYSKQEIDDQIRALEVNRIDDQLNQLQESLREAQRKNNNSELLDITKKIIELKRLKS